MVPGTTKSTQIFMCDPALVDNQFLLSKKIYEQKTGRKQKNDIIAYWVRQAFRLGEVTPEMANKIGYELAEKITKGNNAFIVATHIDRRHVHNHIIWNSTTLDCKRKFRNLGNSTSAVRKISDLLCLKNGLSIVEKPKEKSKDYGSWLGEKRPLALSDKICQSIDLTLAEKPQDFNIFLDKMRVQGYEIKMGKHIFIAAIFFSLSPIAYTVLSLTTVAAKIQKTMSQSLTWFFVLLVNMIIFLLSLISVRFSYQGNKKDLNYFQIGN